MKKLIVLILMLLIIGCVGPQRQVDSSWPQNYQELVKKGKIQIGMTRKMVRAAWGAPRRIYVSEKWERWTYTGINLYFEDEILQIYERFRAE